MPGTLASLWPSALAYLQGCDAILHAGDLHTLDVVDELSAIAQVYVSEGNGDIGIIDERVRPNWSLTFGSFSIGMVHHCPSPERKSESFIKEKLSQLFTELPDIVIFGHTHLEMVYQYADLTLVNPGSPTLPRNQALQLGTLGEIIIEQDKATIRLAQLTNVHWKTHSQYASATISKNPS